MSDSYTVKRYKHGIVIIGSVPMNDMCILMKGWAEDQLYDTVDAAIAQHLGASMVVTTEEKAKIWRQELDINNGD